jgi:hypothetical protein
LTLPLRFVLLRFLLRGWWGPLMVVPPLLGLNSSGPGDGPDQLQEERAEICVLAPQVGSDGSGRASAMVPLSRPTIFAAGRFAEMRIEQQGRVLWQRLATGDQPLEGPIPWPLAPIQPGENLLLRLRPSGAPSSDFAAIGLIGASAGVMRRADTLLHRLGNSPTTWVDAVRLQLDAGDTAMASALLFANEGPNDPALNSLRLEVLRQSCLLRDAPGRFAPLSDPAPGGQVR